ncbi:MAG: alkaline phosphatase D family protein [Thermoanaerobaculales bacterium]|nr:alkaline phosphatase D family protein [Thermoanaerobaculales bacterium]
MKRIPMLRSAFVLGLVMIVSVSATMAAKPSHTGYPRLMQGPMVGAVTDSEAKIWVRTSGAIEVVIVYDTDPEFRSPSETEPVMTEKAEDYAAVIDVTDLEPSTEYFYELRVDGIKDRYLKKLKPLRFETAPPVGDAADLRIAFGSCPKWQDDRVQPIWPWVVHHEPDLFFWIGDNIYGDTLDPDILREEYRRQREVWGLQPLIHNTSNLAVWDDHDYGLNNHDRTNPIKEGAYEVFLDYWPNPSFGLPNVKGIFYTYTWGQVEFFVIDGRWYRDPCEGPDTPEKTMLGAAQYTWLTERLEASTAVFKVLVSGSGWSKNKGEGGDAWSAYLNERNRLFDFIRDREITGVVLMSGDTHVGELNVIPWSENGGYDLYDMVSSPLAQVIPDSWLERRPERRIWPVYFQGSNFGLIDFTMGDDPTMSYRLVDTFGRIVRGPFEVKASELVNGVTSWPDKVESVPRQRQEHYDSGEGYYEIEVDD